MNLAANRRVQVKNGKVLLQARPSSAYRDMIRPIVALDQIASAGMTA